MGSEFASGNEHEEMSKYLVDTTILIDHLRGNIKAKQFIEEQQPYVSTITIAELVQGARDKNELKSVRQLCGSLHEVSIDKKVSKRGIALLFDLHLSCGLMFLDALIAATALENNLLLITGNIKHFNKIDSLQLVSQEELFKKYRLA